MLELVDRIAPIQSQVPRAPFTTIAARLPGTAYADLVDLFESHHLVKASTLRGTVFTSGREQFGWSQRIAREGRAEFLATQTKVAPEQVRGLLTAIEDGSDGVAAVGRPAGPRTRPDGPRGLQSWPSAPIRCGSCSGARPACYRRPPDTAWHKRTDVLRRSARVALAEGPDSAFDESVLAMVERHLRAYGPATANNLCFYLGIRKTPLRRALATLGDRVMTGEGPAGQPMLDLDEGLSSAIGPAGVRRPACTCWPSSTAC